MVALNELIKYWQETLLIVNGIACCLTATILGTFQRRGAQYNFLGSMLALILIVSCGSISIFIAADVYTNINPFETVINVVLCISVFRARGNVLHIFRSTEKK